MIAVLFSELCFLWWNWTRSYWIISFSTEIVLCRGFYWPQRSCGQGNVFTRVCDSVHRGRGVCYPSMHCRWYPSMPCSRSPGGVSAPGGGGVGVCSWGVSAPRGVSAPGAGVSALGGICSGGWPSVMAFCYGLLVWWPSGLVAFWFGSLLIEGGLLFWWPSDWRWPPGLVAFWPDPHPRSRPTPKGEIEGDQIQAHTQGEIEGDQIQAHTQGGNWGGLDPGPHPRGKLRGSDPGPHPRGKLRGIRSRPTPKGKLRGIRSRPTPKGEIEGD